MKGGQKLKKDNQVSEYIIETLLIIQGFYQHGVNCHLNLLCYCGTDKDV